MTIYQAGHTRRPVGETTRRIPTAGHTRRAIGEITVEVIPPAAPLIFDQLAEQYRARLQAGEWRG